MISDSNQNKKPLIFYMAVAVIVIMLLNAFVFPMLLQRQVQEVGYSDFLKMVDSKQVSEVSMDENGEQLIFIAKGKDGQDGIYKTAVFPDNSLRQRLEDAGVSFSAQIPTQNNLLISFIISWVIPIALFWALGRILSRRMTGGMNALSFGKSGAKIVASESTGVTFEDVAGEEEAKEALKEIVDFLEHPDKYASIGAKLPKGALLVGPPGTGKTLLAKAVAGEAKVPFFSIFGGNDEREQTLNQLLTEMDGFDGKKGVVILAATNRPESLDPALLRPGRFDRRIPVELPDVGGREAILRVHSKGIRMADNIDLKAVARATSGASGAELANIINEAALRAVRLGRDTVTQDDLMESVETVIAGYQRKNAVLSESEKKIVSYHEIGHALVASLQTNSAPVTKITIIPRTSGALGYTMQVDEDEHYLMSREELYNKIVTLTGGQAAEQLVFHIEKATRLARGMITRYGMGDFGMVALETLNSQYLGQDTSLACSPAFAEKVDEQVVALVEEARKKADSILREHEDKLHELAAYLLNKETITGEEFMSILKADDQKP